MFFSYFSPEPVTMIDEIQSSTQSINITWTTKHPTCVLNYQLEAITSTNSMKSMVLNDKNFYLFESLLPCRDYSITLQTININKTLISTLSNQTTTKYEGKYFCTRTQNISRKNGN